MASRQLPLPSPMNFSGNLSIEWKIWRQRFEIYLTASGRQESTDKVKVSLLLHALGSVRAELQRMVESGVIEEVTEPTACVSPMVPVPKKNGSVRICVDLTRLNRSVQREQFQLPTADQLIASLHGAKYFFTLDAASAFSQIPLSEDCSSLTTFISPFGRYHFKRLPFGITSGPEVFHRAMQHILAGQAGAVLYE